MARVGELGLVGRGAALGISLRAAVQQLRRWTELQIVYDADAPGPGGGFNCVVDLPLDGMRLVFDGRQQRLELVDVYDLSKSTFVHNGTVPFSGPAQNPRLPPGLRHVRAHLPGPAHRRAA